jgi:Ca-activated chloride channel family protein
VDVDVVQITAVVTDNQGKFVSGLKQSDFKVSEDGATQKLSSFSDEHTPLELITAIDVSSSVTDALPGMKTAAARFVGGLEPADQVTVLGFNDNIFTLAKRSTDQVVRERAIGRLRAWGGTALYDAVVQGIDLLGRQQGRRAIILFTDGKDENSHAPMETAIAQVEASDAMIYPIGQGRAVHDKDLQKLLQRVATTSGGRAFFASTPSKLDEVFSEILDDLHHQYLLSYPAPDDQRDGKWHKITVTAGGGKYRVRARQGYRYTQKR